MGLDIYLNWKEMTDEEEKARYTGFANAGEAGYLRSSYNESGFNSWAGKYIGGRDFYYIFQPNGEYEFTPDWQACLERAKEALVEARKVVNEPVIITCHSELRPEKLTEETVLAKFHEVVDKNKQSKLKGFDWFSNFWGDFFLSEPPKVLAVMPIDRFGPAVALVCKPSKDSHKHYIDTLKHTIEFVKLGMSKPEAYITWSG